MRNRLSPTRWSPYKRRCCKSFAVIIVAFASRKGLLYLCQSISALIYDHSNGLTDTPRHSVSVASA